MALAVHRTQIEELIAERVALLLLREDVLQRESEFSKPGCFGPRTFALFVFNQCNIRKKSAAAVRALFETSLKLVREDVAQCVELCGFDCVVLVDEKCPRLRDRCLGKSEAKAPCSPDCASND